MAAYEVPTMLVIEGRSGAPTCLWVGHPSGSQSTLPTFTIPLPRFFQGRISIWITSILALGPVSNWRAENIASNPDASAQYFNFIILTDAGDTLRDIEKRRENCK